MADRVKLTKRMLERLEPVTRETWVMDSEVVGLGVRQRPNANASFVMRWKDANSRDKKFTIGLVSKVELEAARAIAKQRFSEVAAGENPIEKRKNERMWSHTIADVIEDAEIDLQNKKRSPTYIRDFKQQMRDYVIPSIGSTLVKDVQPSDIDRILAKLSSRAALHNRVRAGLSRLFQFAIRMRYRFDNPVAGTIQQTEQPRTRLLGDKEVDAILDILNKSKARSSDAMRLLYFTGSRPKELFGSQWRDFDLENGVWTKPAQTVKQRRVHTVTLHKIALAVLKRIADEDLDPLQQARPGEKVSLSPDAFVFPGPGKGGHLTTIKRHAATVFKAAGVGDVRPYDLRKAFTSRLVASGADLRTIMSLTGHTQVAVLIKHYAHVMDGKQKELLASVFGE